jgi:murein DD-endopeptidase MepM/ murein hydrolase activator NlpD
MSDEIRIDEPPIHNEDTTPRPASAPSDEPALAPDDTSPSRAMAAPRCGPQRLFAGVMVVGALILVGASIVLLLGLGDDESAPEPTSVAGNPDTAPTTRATATTPPSPSPAPTTPAATAVAANQTDTAPLVAQPVAPDAPDAADSADMVPVALFPTAAADEVSAALALPVPDASSPGVIQRQSEPFTIRGAQARTKVVLYTVNEGDTLDSIAARFGLDDIYTIIWSNSQNKVNPLRPGSQLYIMPEDGIYHQVTENISITRLAEMYSVDPYTIIDSEYNTLFGSTPETLLPEGLAVAVPGGEAERMIFLPPNPNAGASGGGGAGGVSGSYTLWGCSANVGGGTMPYGRPLGNYTWMRGFTRGYHEGVDIAANPGDPVYAAGAGTVVYAGWRQGGYGNVVVLAHGSVFTIYAHLTAANVGCGQQVNAGQVIGTVGSTGNSTGPHLHFEVRTADFTAVNPQSYVSF